MSIAENYRKIREGIPESVSIVLAAKTRTKEEVLQAIEAGATDIGENYVQEAQRIREALGPSVKRVKWHMIGRLQENKINKALLIFDVIQSVDSYKKAEDIDKRVEAAGKSRIPVLIEVNIGSEMTKTGVKPDYASVEKLVREMSGLEHITVEGLMTMGPRFGNPENSRPYFRKAKEVSDKIEALDLPGVSMQTLSMGMSNSYKVAIEEGSNMVRIGTAVFGKRNYGK
jgi:pyridoxal phosphate enzyme (YggS family)